jgi:ankyrin repeat protein
MHTVKSAASSLVGNYDLDKINRILRPIHFSIGSGRFRSSRQLDKFLRMALMGNPKPLARLFRQNKKKRAACALAGCGVTCLDAWAFQRAYAIGGRDLPLLRRYGKFGMLRHARHPDHDATLAHALVNWHQGPKMWQILASSGVDLNLEDANGATPLSLAARNSNDDLMVTLFALGANPSAISWDSADVRAFSAQIAAKNARRLMACSPRTSPTV